MRKQKRFLWVAIVAAGLVVAPACVSKKVFRKHAEETDTRIKGVESGVEDNQRRISNLATETDVKISQVRSTAEKAMEVGSSALTKAELAEKLAKGKVLWTTTLSDDRVKFSFDAATIPPEAAAILDDLAAKVKALDKTVYLEIEGHTDSIGSEQYNYELGLKRAEAVLRYLNERGGLPLHLMSVISYGETKPVADNRTPDGRARNRRVVVRVLE
jgi:outer membrane protein OmpA-like peptidoglycan-associated protein